MNISSKIVATTLLAALTVTLVPLSAFTPPRALATAALTTPEPEALFPIFYIPKPSVEPALQEVPVADKDVRGHTADIVKNTAVTAASARTETKQSLSEWLMRFIRETLRKQLLDMIVSQIINWIQGGGTPKFITDWQGFLANAGNIAAGQFAQELGLGFLCRPFALQLKLALGVGTGRSRFSQQISCTLGDIVGNVNNFYNNFGNGGWNGYQNMLQPQNNFYGAYLMGYTRLAGLNYQGRTAALAEAQAGGGFLGTKECRKDSSGRDIPSTCRITTPGQTIGQITAKAVGTDIDYILSAQELEQYVSAIADALINRLVLEGVHGLAGLTNSAGPSGGSIPPGTSGCAGLSGSAQGSCQNYLNPNFNGPIPTRPTGLEAHAAATSTPTIRLTWNDNATTETGYIVEHSLDYVAGFYPISYDIPANTTSYTDTAGLTRGTRYYYRVRAFNGTGSSDYSNIADEVAP